MAIHLGRPLPNASRDRPERRRESSPGTGVNPCLPLLLGLAPGGVFPAVTIAGDAVRSYRTISPLPPMETHEVGGVFSVALSLGSPPPAVNRHRAFRGARTFLPSHCWKERPSDRLAVGLYGPVSPICQKWSRFATAPAKAGVSACAGRSQNKSKNDGLVSLAAAPCAPPVIAADDRRKTGGEPPVNCVGRLRPRPVRTVRR